MDRNELADALPAVTPALARFALSLTRDPHEAEDLTQEVLVRAMERASTFRGESSLGTWLHRIAHNLAVDRARRRREEPAEDVVEQVEARWRRDAWTVDAAEVAARAETRRELEDALIRLPVAYRAAVILHDAEGMTVAQIADIAEVSLPAAKQRLRRGRMMLVTALAHGGERAEARRGVPMRCWDARLMVGDLLDGTLPPRDTEAVTRHLAACPTCPPLYASLVATTDALARTGRTATRDPDSVVDPAQAERIRATRS